MRSASIKPAHLNRYLRVHREAAPVRANREIALLSNLLNVAVNRGDLDANPCRQVRRNKETPRPEAPAVDALARFLAWAEPESPTLAGMAEFAALVGSRRMEFLKLAGRNGVPMRSA
jgi:integrase